VARKENRPFEEQTPSWGNEPQIRLRCKFRGWGLSLKGLAGMGSVAEVAWSEGAYPVAAKSGCQDKRSRTRIGQ
jgi:hypothetical protein